LFVKPKSNITLFIQFCLTLPSRKTRFSNFITCKNFAKKIFLEIIVSQFMQRTKDQEKRKCSIDPYGFLRKILDSYSEGNWRLQIIHKSAKIIWILLDFSTASNPRSIWEFSVELFVDAFSQEKIDFLKIRLQLMHKKLFKNQRQGWLCNESALSFFFILTLFRRILPEYLGKLQSIIKEIK